tara:strand:+ start:94 stop:924 length:831 start_codon:yes stop_codon:yes gene_type:complete
MNNSIVPKLSAPLVSDQSNVEEYYIFATCRICNLDHENIKFIKKIKNVHSNYYTINGNNLYTQPVNYTHKLSDVLDSIIYHKGLYDNTMIEHVLFKQMFFLHDGLSEYINPNTHPLSSNKSIIYNKCILEIWNLDEYIFKDGPFKNKNLPFKIESVHRTHPFNQKDLYHIKELSENETHEKIRLIKNLVSCPILIVGPYLSLTMPPEVNIKRKRTQQKLKKICELENIEYYDMTEEIIKDNTILISAPGRESHETHFTDQGIKIMSNIVYNFLNKN